MPFKIHSGDCARRLLFSYLNGKAAMHTLSLSICILLFHADTWHIITFLVAVHDIKAASSDVLKESIIYHKSCLRAAKS